MRPARLDRFARLPFWHGHHPFVQLLNERTANKLALRSFLHMMNCVRVSELPMESRPAAGCENEHSECGETPGRFPEFPRGGEVLSADRPWEVDCDTAGTAFAGKDSLGIWFGSGGVALQAARTTGPQSERPTAAIGDSFVDKNVKTWRSMIRVLDSGEHCHTHSYARRPEG
jgi:hypothetical protein